MNEMQGTRVRRIAGRRGGVALAATAVLALAACGVGDVIEGGAHEPVAKIDVADARRETMEGLNIDPDIVGPLMSPQTPGRLIYDEPVSLAEVAAADTLVRRENTGTASAESPERIARDSAAARASSAEARRRAAPGQSGAPRDSGGSAPPRPERR
jgi:hypothetical protein